MLTLGSKINRSYSIHIPFNGMYMDIGVFFNKNNTFLGFTIDPKSAERVRDGKLSSHLYKDLTQSSFATTFLDIKDFSSPTLDIRNQFSNILPKCKDKVQYLLNETIKLSKYTCPHDSSKHFESLIHIYLLTFTDYSEDFVYCLAERQHIDISLGKKLVRTGALQVCTKQCKEDLKDMISFYNDTGDKSNEYTSIDSAVEDLFSDEFKQVRKL